MLRIDNINIDCTAVKIPLKIDLQDWVEVVNYAKSTLFSHHDVTYDVVPLPFDAVIPADAIVINADSLTQLDLDLSDALHNGPYHENVVFEPAYLPSVYIDEAMIKDSANWEFNTNIHLAVFEVLESHFIIDGSMVDIEPEYEIACPQANALASLLDMAIVNANNGLDTAELTNNDGVLSDEDKPWVIAELTRLKDMFTDLVEAVDGRINMRG